MTENKWKTWVGAAGKMLLAFAFIFAQSAWAGQDQKTKAKTGAPKGAAEQSSEKQSTAATTVKTQTEESQGEAPQRTVAAEKASADGTHEGIKVHGHWTIEVRNPDGSLVTHREFENSLQPGVAGGNAYLSELLACDASAVSCNATIWYIYLQGTPAPCLGGTTPAPCILVQSTDNQSHFPSSNSVVTSVANQGTTFVLTGNATATNNGSIGAVATSPLASTTTSLAPHALTFTSTNLATPIPVSTGQFIQVIVVISFS